MTNPLLLTESEKMEIEKAEIRIIEMGANSSPEAMKQLLRIINGLPIVNKPVNNYAVEYLRL